MQEQLLTPLLLQIEPGARSGPPVSHDGQDFIFCLRGEILYMVNGQGYVLAGGDSLLFDGRLAHRFLNPGTEVASLLIILSTPHDSAQYINAHFNNNT